MPLVPLRPLIPIIFPFIPFVPLTAELAVGVPSKVIWILVLDKRKPGKHWHGICAKPSTATVKPSGRLQILFRHLQSLLGTLWALASLGHLRVLHLLIFWFGCGMGSELMLTMCKFAIITISAPPWLHEVNAKPSLWKVGLVADLFDAMGKIARGATDAIPRNVEFAQTGLLERLKPHSAWLFLSCGSLPSHHVFHSVQQTSGPNPDPNCGGNAKKNPVSLDFVKCIFPMLLRLQQNVCNGQLSWYGMQTGVFVMCICTSSVMSYEQVYFPWNRPKKSGFCATNSWVAHWWNTPIGMRCRNKCLNFLASSDCQWRIMVPTYNKGPGKKYRKLWKKLTARGPLGFQSGQVLGWSVAAFGWGDGFQKKVRVMSGMWWSKSPEGVWCGSPACIPHHVVWCVMMCKAARVW